MNLTIIGLGLIGGSFGLSLKDSGLFDTIIGVDNNVKHQKLALELNLIDEILPLKKAIEQADMIILATPVNASEELLPKILTQLKPHQFIMDVGSIKSDIVKAVKTHPNRSKFIATHPMWGTEFSGPTAARKNELKNRKTIICNEQESNLIGLELVKKIYNYLNMEIIYMDAIEHDLHVAYISHISHITSFALANTVLEKEKNVKTIFDLASTGFESTVRLAKSNPKTWTPILIENKKNILVVLDELLRQLNLYKKCLQNDSEVDLNHLIHEANKIIKILK